MQVIQYQQPENFNGSCCCIFCPTQAVEVQSPPGAVIGYVNKVRRARVNARGVTKKRRWRQRCRGGGGGLEMAAVVVVVEENVN